MSQNSKVYVRQDNGPGVDTAWFEDDGRLVVEWYEWRSDNDDNGVPYDHADTISFDADAQQRLANALNIPGGEQTPGRLLSEIPKRFSSWFEVRDFAEKNEIPFIKRVDFQP